MFWKRASQPEQFWSWFAGNPNLRRLPSRALVDRIGPRLRKYHRGLVCEVTGPEEDPRELVISADGLVEHAEWVERLADAAPDIEGWRVVRFRPSAPDFDSVTITWDGVEARASDVRFVAKSNGVRVDLDIYAHWRSDPDDVSPDGPTFILLDHSLGEYNVMFGIKHIDVHPIESAPAEAEPWSKVAERFQELFEQSQ